jgi:uncharacterized protein DUF4865
MSNYNQILIQHETPLPDDFDMEQIRARVRDLGPQTDQYPGLQFKLYGVNTKTAAANEYSSIWLWSNLEPMREFLEGAFFDNYVKAFARPSVRTWFIHETTGDRSSVVEARQLLRRIAAIPRQQLVGSFLNSWQQREERPDALFRIVAFDAFNWQLADFTLWNEPPSITDRGHLYSLAHVSRPTQ